MRSAWAWISRPSIASLPAHVHAARVREDFMSGVHSGVNGTPTFYVNGRRYDGSYETESLLAALRDRSGP